MSNGRDRRPAMFDRRQLLRGVTGAAAVGALAVTGNRQSFGTTAVTNGRINQSIVNWCFADDWDLEEQCQIAKRLGCKSIELIPPEQWPTLKKYDLQCAIVPSHLFVQGMNNPRYQPGQRWR